MSHNEWIKLIEEFEKSGMTQYQWCREKKITYHSFKNHYKLYETEKQNGDRVWMAIELNSTSTTSSKLNIKIGKAVIELESGYDEKLFQDVVKSLEAIC